MHITVINPNTTESMTREIKAAAEAVAAPGTIIEAVTAAFGAPSVENYHDHQVSSLAVMNEVHRLNENRQTDGFVIACYGDPGLRAAREITECPVIGIAEASMYMASIVAPKFSIISDLPRFNGILEEMLYSYGMEGHCASIRTTGLTVLEADEDPERTLHELAGQCRLAVKEDGAEALLLGCAGLVMFTEELEKELKLPVFDGVIAAVKMLEGLISLGKRTSKICTYARPNSKEYVRQADFLPAGRIGGCGG